MSDDNNNVSRREALKGIAVGLGTSLPVLNTNVLAQQGAAHDGHAHAQASGEKKAPYQAKFFNAGQMALIATVSDLMISESSAETKKLWTDGLVAIDNMSRNKFQAEFNKATSEQQVALLTEIS